MDPVPSTSAEGLRENHNLKPPHKRKQLHRTDEDISACLEELDAESEEESGGTWVRAPLADAGDSDIEDGPDEVQSELDSDDEIEDPNYEVYDEDVRDAEIMERIHEAEMDEEESQRTKHDESTKKRQAGSKAITKKKRVSTTKKGAENLHLLSNQEPLPAAPTSSYVVECDVPQLMSKQGFVWKTKPEKSQVKVPKRNIIHTRQRPAPNVLNMLQPSECFNLFFSTDMHEKIVENTNQEMARQRENYNDKQAKDPTLREITLPELRAYLGLLILAAALKNNHLSANKLFDSSLCGDRYRATMSERRFSFISNCLRFDDKYTRSQRQVEDRLAPISELWELLLNNCRNNYSVGPYVTIDEQLIAFRGRCVFRMYMPNKPNKYGIKIIMLCDAGTYYMKDAIAYVGKTSVPDGIGVAQFFVEKLCTTIEGSNRNVTVDQWFTSVQLFEKLLEKKLTAVGTIRKDKPQLPAEFKDHSYMGRQLLSSMFLFTENLTAVSYKSKPNKLVTLLSSMHDEASVNQEEKKPEMIRFYNQTKGGVDVFDRLCANMNCGRKTRRWPMCFFYNMLNISCINAFVIYSHNVYRDGEKPLSRLDFMIELHKQLVTPWLMQRMSIRTMRTSVKVFIRNVLGIPELATPAIADQQRENKKGPRKYCTFCPTKLKRMTTTYCSCGNAICGEHQTKRCPNC